MGQGTKTKTKSLNKMMIGKKQDFCLKDALKVSLYSIICIIYTYIYMHAYT